MSDESAAEKVALIINPRAAGGRAGKLFNDLEPRIDKLFSDLTIFETAHRRHATELTRQALHDGAHRIISVGGDGTQFEVINGFFENDQPVNPDAILAILPLGTGSDLAKTLDIPPGEGAIPYLNSTAPVRSDLGRVTLATDRGEESFYFISSAHTGLGAEISRRVNEKSKAFGGFATFLRATLISLFTYENKPMEMKVGDETVSGTFKNIVLSNGLYDGGGMRPARRARINSGVFEVNTMGDASALSAIANLPRVYKGTVHEHPNATYHQATRVTLTSPESVLVAIDGEPVGTTPATFELVPEVLNIVTGKNPAVV